MLKVKEVISTLKKYETAEKVTHRLCRGKSCFCIEGVFCKVAGDLMVDIQQRNAGWDNSLFVYKGAVTAITIPNDVLEELSLPNLVEKKYLVEAGLDQYLKGKGDRSNESHFTWIWLNDETELSLAQLIQLALLILKDKENVS